MHAIGRRPTNRRWAGVGMLLITVGLTQVVAAIGGADTNGNPDPATKAAVDPATPTAAPPGPIDNAVQGTKVNIRVDGSNGNFFGIGARLCKPDLNIVTASQMSPTQFGNCLAHPFSASDQDDPTRTDDSFVTVNADATHSFAQLSFRVGVGSETFTANNGSSTIECGPGKPCDLWLDEQVSTAVASSGHVFKHYRINYAGGGGGTTTTTSSTTTSTTQPGGGTTTTTTAGGGTTTTTQATTTTTQATTTTTQATTTTTHATTTTTQPTGGPTTTTQAGGTTTTTEPDDTTTTTQPDGTTTTTAAQGTTTTTAVEGGSVSPSSAPPGGSININSTGWTGNVTVTFNSTPVVLGQLTADADGAIHGTFAVPSGAAAGAHTIVLSGAGADGNPRTLVLPFTVVAAGTSSSGGATLPRTGSSHVADQAWLGAWLIAAGAALVVRSRRTQTS